MKKILIIETSAFRGRGSGGSFLQARYYLDLLLQKGYDASIFIGETHENQNKKKLKVVRKIREADYVIGFGTPLLCSYLQWLCFFLGKKGIFCIDTYISSRDIIKDHLKRKMFPTKIIIYTAFSSLLNKIFMLFLPPKLNLVTLFSCQYILDKVKYSRLPDNVDSFLYPRIIFKKRIEAPHKPKTVLFYGTLYRGRGVRDLIQSCRILWRKNYDFKLIILGWPIDSFTKKHIANDIRNIDKRKIVLKGYVSNVWGYLKEASGVVLPFRYPCSFQTPYTLLEPMGCGVPVVTTDVGSHNEWIKDRETGVFCEKENIKDIAAKIEMVFNDGALVKRMTQNAYKLLEKRYKEKDLLLETLKKLEHER